MSISTLEAHLVLPDDGLVSVRKMACQAAEFAASAQTLEWVDAVLAGKLRQYTLERYRKLLSELPAGGAAVKMYPDLSVIGGSDAALIAQAMIDVGAYDDAKKLLLRTFARLDEAGRKWGYANAIGCRLLGDLCRRANDFEVAETWYRAALRCYPIYREALIACGELCIDRDPADALELLYRAHMMLDLPPTHYRIQDGSVLVINHAVGWVIVLYCGFYVGLRGSFVPHQITAEHAQGALDAAHEAANRQTDIPRSRRWWSRRTMTPPQGRPYNSVVDPDYMMVLQAVSR